MSGRSASIASLLVAVAGCGMTNLQTARTVPAGESRFTVGAGVIHNSDRGWGGQVPAIPVDVMYRRGATDQIDWGVRLFMGEGLLGDVKWNVLRPDRRTALAISAGLGAANVPGIADSAGAQVASVPLTITASHTFPHGSTPYGAVGYGSYWIFNYGTPDPTMHAAPRRWTGDGLLGLHAGIELATASGRALLLEYVYARPIVDDPGDHYAFATNQFFMIAFHTGGPSVPTGSR